MGASYTNSKLETIPADERKAIIDLTASIKDKVKTHRDAHAKNHGCIDGAKLKIRQDLPEDLQVGFFTPGREFDVVIRSSPGSGDAESNDWDGGAEGFAAKLLLKDEDQKRLVSLFGENQFFVDKNATVRKDGKADPRYYYRTFDIVTISRAREFFAETVADYPFFFVASGIAGQTAGKVVEDGKAEIQKLLADGKKDEAAKLAKELPTNAKIAANAVMEKYYYTGSATAIPDPNKVQRPRPREKEVILTLGRAHTKNPLTETYSSFVPSLFGKDKAGNDRAVKYEWAPCAKVDPEAYKIPAALGDLSQNKSFISEVLKYALREKQNCYKLNVIVSKPGFPSIEDSVAAWPSDTNPYVEIGTLTIPKKDAGKELMDNEFCERASFHPGHAPLEQFPVGNIQRARVGGPDYEGIYTTIAIARNLNLNKAQEEASTKK